MMLLVPFHPGFLVNLEVQRLANSGPRSKLCCLAVTLCGCSSSFRVCCLAAGASKCHGFCNCPAASISNTEGRGFSCSLHIPHLRAKCVPRNGWHGRVGFRLASHMVQALGRSTNHLQAQFHCEDTFSVGDLQSRASCKVEEQEIG